MAQANFVNGSGSIKPSVFVVFDTATDKSVNQASGATSFIIGVSGEYSKYAPISGASTVAADAPGDPILVYQEGDTCYLNATSAGFNNGDRITSDANGNGITTTTSGQYYGAVALVTLSGAGLGQVKIVTGKNP